MEELITALAPLVALAVVALRSWIQARVTPERLAAVSQLARVAVDAAEEIGRATDVKPGDKFEYAETFLKQAAQRVGIKLTNEEANAFIHAVLTGRNEAVQSQVDAILDDWLTRAEAERLAHASE